jgi:hypothetical protein
LKEKGHSRACARIARPCLIERRNLQAVTAQPVFGRANQFSADDHRDAVILSAGNIREDFLLDFRAGWRVGVMTAGRPLQAIDQRQLRIRRSIAARSLGRVRAVAPSGSWSLLAAAAVVARTGGNRFVARRPGDLFET